MTYVLIVDDSELIVSMLDMVCSQAGFATRTCTDFASIRTTVDQSVPLAVLSDLNMPDMPHDADPVTSLAEIGLGGIPVVLISGISQAEIDKVAADLGAAGAISKDAGMMGMATLIPALLSKF